MNYFRIIITGIFILFLVLAILIFSGLIPIGKSKGSNQGVKGNVVLWGTIPNENLSPIIENFNANNEDLKVSYKEKKSESFDSELIEALASGAGPDLILLPDNLINRYQDKIFLIPYESFSIRDFKDIFIQQGELYLNENGILALPFSVDPMVMYYNRDMFSSAGISKPPENWEDFFEIVPLLTKRDQSTNILTSAVSFGEFANITHAKDIISMLLLQSGNPIIIKHPGTEGLSQILEVTLADSSNPNEESPASITLDFYTEFSNPASNTEEGLYSWNKSLLPSQDAFISEKLAIYFGYASELFIIQERNPNLNFDVVMVPQAKNINTKITFGRMNALAIAKTSPNINTSFIVANLLTKKDFIENLSKGLSLPPVRRDLLFVKPKNPYTSIFYDSALISRSWFDPSPKETSEIFEKMVDDIISGRLSIKESVSKAHNGIELIANNIK